MRRLVICTSDPVPPGVSYLLPLGGEGGGPLQLFGRAGVGKVGLGPPRPQLLLDGGDGDEVGVGLGEVPGELQVQNVFGDGTHPPQGAGALLETRARRARPASRLPVPHMPRPGRGTRTLGLVLVHPGVEDGPVHHLGLGLPSDLQARGLAVRAREGRAQAGRLEQVSVAMGGHGLRGAELPDLSVQLEGVVRGLAGRRRAVEQAGKLLRDVGVPKTALCRSLSLTRDLLCGPEGEGRGRERETNIKVRLVRKKGGKWRETERKKTEREGGRKKKSVISALQALKELD